MPLINKLLDEAERNDVLLEESRSILAYAMMHPIFEGQEEYRSELIRHVQKLQAKMLQPENNHSGYCSSSNGSFSEYSETDSSDESASEETPAPDQDKNSFLEQDSGMQDVPKWLKSLRLHKYQFLFAKLTYEEMLALDEDKLKEVTKGARNKILENVVKLRERAQRLSEYEQRLSAGQVNPKDLSDILAQMKMIVQTPMRQESPIPALYTRTLAKIYNQLHNQLPFIFHQYHQHHPRLSQVQSGEDDITAFLFCADQAMKNMCFSAGDKENIRKWHEIIQGCQNARKKRAQPKTGSNSSFGSISQNRRPLTGGSRPGGQVGRNTLQQQQRRPNHHSHQRSVPNPSGGMANWVQQMHQQQQQQQFTHNYSPSALSPPQNYHKRASSFDPHLIQRTPSFPSPDSLQGSQQSLLRSKMSVPSSIDRLDGQYNSTRDLTFDMHS